MKIPEELANQLKAIGYTNLKYIPNRGVCGLSRMAFTFGVVYGLDNYGMDGRFCYHSEEEAIAALKAWDGNGDPMGNWIVNKGEPGGDRLNPNHKELSDEERLANVDRAIKHIIARHSKEGE